eukprot:62644-Pyramimonas_sp.AAC.1
MTSCQRRGIARSSILRPGARAPLRPRACLLRAATKSAVFLRHGKWARDEEAEGLTCFAWRQAPMARNLSWRR